MANGNFVVQNGLQIGPLTIDAATGSITTTGNINSTSGITVVTQELVLGTEVVAGNLTANSGTTSTNTTTGALVVVGGVGVSGNINMGGNLNIGAPLNYSPLNAPVRVGFNINGYSQFAIQNTNSGNNASTDIAAVANNGSDNDTYIDMGILSSTYSQAAYSIYYPNDGYVIVSGNTTTGGGNLVLTTTNANDIVFATYGQNANNEVMRVTSGNVVKIKSTLTSTSTTTGALQVAGGAGIAGNIFISGNVATTSTGAWTIPNGTSAQRPGAATLGMIRYNNSISSFEGYGAGSTWSSLGGVKSVDGYAYISAEASAGAGDDVLRFYSGSTGSSVQVAWMSAGNISILPATTATSTTTGALQVTGGISTQGNLYVGGNLVVNGATTTINNTVYETTEYVNTIDATTVRAATIGNALATLTGATITTSSTGIHYGNLVAASGTSSSSTTTGALVVVGGAGISGAVYAGSIQNTPIGSTTASTGAFTTLTSSSTSIHYGNVVAASGTASTNTTTGALVVVGGAGISGAVYAGSVYDNGTRVVSTSTSAGNLTISAGAINLTATGPGATSVGSSTAIPVITTDAYGRVASTTTAAVVAPAGTLTGSTLASGVTASSLTSVGTLTGLTVSGQINVGANVNVTGYVMPTANVTYSLGSGTTWWNGFYGTAVHSLYADLAENYLADQTYQPGTVVMFGGPAEVTVAGADTTAVAGVVSTNPGHLMNGGLSGTNVVPVAFTGRVPCMVIGPVKKGDLMTSAGFGYAKTNNTPAVGAVIGKALADFTGAKGVIEVVVGRF